MTKHRRPTTGTRPVTGALVKKEKEKPGPGAVAGDTDLLARILDTPHLAQVVPHLPAEVIHKVIQACGLADCGDLVTLATPAQLSQIFDLDMWGARHAGLDETLDARRFGLWLEVLMEAGAAIAAQKLLGIDIDLVVSGLAQHLRVFDRAAVSPADPGDGDELPDPRSRQEGGLEIGNYLVEAQRDESWGAITDLLIFLNTMHPAFFDRVMSGCRHLSDSRPEIDGLDALLEEPDQKMFDLASGREARREKQGFAVPADARTFLDMARHVDLRSATMPLPDPMARAYFRAIDPLGPDDGRADRGSRASLPAAAPSVVSKDVEAAAAAIIGMLADTGVLPAPRALLGEPRAEVTRLDRIHAHMRAVRAANDAAFATRTEELGYLANTLLAGCPIQGRSFTEREASDAAVAVCNLGLENWPRQWRPEVGLVERAPGGVATDLPDDFLVAHDLVTVFQVGWRVLYENVIMHTAERLIAVLAELPRGDRETHAALSALRVQMAKGWRAGEPWRARDGLEAIVMLDMPAWATLLGLIAPYPVIHAGLAASSRAHARTVSASDFEYISENSQIRAVREVHGRAAERAAQLTAPYRRRTRDTRLTMHLDNRLVVEIGDPGFDIPIGRNIGAQKKDAHAARVEAHFRSAFQRHDSPHDKSDGGCLAPVHHKRSLQRGLTDVSVWYRRVRPIDDQGPRRRRIHRNVLTGEVRRLSNGDE